MSVRMRAQRATERAATRAVVSVFLTPVEEDLSGSRVCAVKQRSVVEHLMARQERPGSAVDMARRPRRDGACAVL